jgi:hypothetical protein
VEHDLPGQHRLLDHVVPQTDCSTLLQLPLAVANSLPWHLTDSEQTALNDTWKREYQDSTALIHAEGAVLMHLLDPSQPDVTPQTNASSNLQFRRIRHDR